MGQKRDSFELVTIKTSGNYVADAEGIVEQGLRESPVPYFWREISWRWRRLSIGSRAQVTKNCKRGLNGRI